MKVGWIDTDMLSHFETLLLPDVAAACRRGETMTLMGLAEGTLAVGALAGFMGTDVFHVRSLYVAGEYRRRGGGHMLLKSLAEMFAGLPVYTVQVLFEFTVTEPEHRELIAFLEAEGFTAEQDRGENIFVTTLGGALQTPFFKKAAGGSAHIVPFSKVTKGALSIAQKKALQADTPFPEGGLSGAGTDKELSMAYVRDGGEVCAFLTVGSGDGALTISSVWNGSGDPRLLPLLFRACALRAGESYGGDTPVVCQTIDRTTAQLRSLILPQAEPVSYTYYRFYTKERLE